MPLLQSTFSLSFLWCVLYYKKFSFKVIRMCELGLRFYSAVGTVCMYAINSVSIIQTYCEFEDRINERH